MNDKINGKSKIIILPGGNSNKNQMLQYRRWQLDEMMAKFRDEINDHWKKQLPSILDTNRTEAIKEVVSCINEMIDAAIDNEYHNTANGLQLAIDRIQDVFNLLEEDES